MTRSTYIFPRNYEAQLQLNERKVRVGRAAMVICVIQLDMQGHQCCGTEFNVESGPWLVSDSIMLRGCDVRLLEDCSGLKVLLSYTSYH